MYKLILKKEAQKKLKLLPSKERFRILNKLLELSRNPDNDNLDIKQLSGEPYLRLRVGDWRIIYLKDDVVKIIAIQKIKSRGDVYK